MTGARGRGRPGASPARSRLVVAAGVAAKCTYTQNTSSLTRRPSAWCLKSTSTCARFFGGQHSSDSTALMWQWSGGGGTSNGYGDFDQIGGARIP